MRSYIILLNILILLSYSNKVFSQNDKIEKYLNDGYTKYESKDYKGAIISLNKLIALVPENGVSYFLRGKCFFELNLLEAALFDFDKVIELLPDNSEAWFDRVRTKTGMNDFSGGIQDYTQAIKINPKFAIAYFNRGNAHYYLINVKDDCDDWPELQRFWYGSADIWIKKYCK